MRRGSESVARVPIFRNRQQVKLKIKIVWSVYNRAIAVSVIGRVNLGEKYNKTHCNSVSSQ